MTGIPLGSWRLWVGTVGLAVAFALCGGMTPAQAFDTGPHTEMLSDAMTAEGFGGDAIQLAEVNNWLVDLYSEGENPFSGHGGWFNRLLAGAITTEEWPASVIAAAARSHFDNIPNTAAETAEWARLQRAVWGLAQEARERDDPEELVAVLGISLHPVQDFYSHTNWVEPQGGHGLPGSDGPGWRERGFGGSPTWFDVPAAVREAATIYSGEYHPQQPHGNRMHGVWNSDGNLSLRHAMNKDWPGRPYYLPAATTAYFATRQWIEAVRAWVGDDALWAEAQRFSANHNQLDHDLDGMVGIQRMVGHWQGQGEPFHGAEGSGGSLLDLRNEVKSYFQVSGIGTLRGRTKYRARFERLIKRVADPSPTGQLGPVPSSQDLQRSTQFVVLRVRAMRSEGVFGLGDPWPDEADMYANVGIDGQRMTSAIINDENSFVFPRPNAPFTWIKAVPAVPDEEEPVDAVEVVVRTANVRWAGTNDDVELCLGPRLCFPLDKRFYDDFEQGDSDRYSVPIDEAVRDGLTVGEISEVRMRKSPDGIAGGWKLGGVEVFANGREIYDNQHVERWLEDDRRAWTAPDFTPSDPRGPEVPVWLDLREHDLLYGSDDRGDINPRDNRDIVAIGYTPGQSVVRTFKGGNELGGRLGYGGDRASVTIQLQTLIPQLIGEGQEEGSSGEAPPPVAEPPPANELPVTVPEVRGLPLAEAEEVLRSLGLRPTGGGEVIDSTCMYIGEVATQSPFAGSRVLPGTVVNLRVGVRDPNPIHYCK